jgi:hypothetical protein
VIQTNNAVTVTETVVIVVWTAPRAVTIRKEEQTVNITETTFSSLS